MPTFDHGLDFRDLDDAVAYARRCLNDGYEQTGLWDLAQTCRHLSDWMKVPMDGAPQIPLVMSLTMAVVRRTITPRLLRQVLAERKLQSGMSTIVATIHPPEADAVGAVEQFAATATRLAAHAGPWQWSPLFHTPDRERSLDLQLVHCMHHLGRLKPRSTGRSA
jgi:Protein of unknown function (DUF1569)